MTKMALSWSHDFFRSPPLYRNTSMRSIRTRRGQLSIILASLAMPFSTAINAQSLDVSCDAHLQPIPGSQGYQKRTGAVRCEGMYRSPVSGFGLEVVSFITGGLSFDLERDRQLSVLVPVTPSLLGEAVHVRAVGLPLRTYYRMDALVAPGERL